MSKQTPATLLIKHALIGFSVGLSILAGLAVFALVLWVFDFAITVLR